MSNLMNWQELPIGGVILEAGSAARYETGTWRTWKPVTHREHCSHCLKCWEYCPEDAILMEDGIDEAGTPRRFVKDVNYYHCKGCGLCVRECPVNKEGLHKALEMVRDEV